MQRSENRPITLTFDNGPHPEATPMVLDILARRGILTTFFVVGQELVQHRALAERAHAEGHWIGNHTWSHSHPFREKKEVAFVHDEIERTQREIGNLSHPDKFFRPYNIGALDGALTPEAARHLVRGGYSCVLWNSLPWDSRDAEGWPETAFAQFEKLAWPLVVLHDAFPLATAQLDRFIGTALDRGYIFRQEIPADGFAIYRGQETKVMQSGVLAR